MATEAATAAARGGGLTTEEADGLLRLLGGSMAESELLDLDLDDDLTLPSLSPRAAAYQREQEEAAMLALERHRARVRDACTWFRGYRDTLSEALQLARRLELADKEDMKLDRGALRVHGRGVARRLIFRATDAAAFADATLCATSYFLYVLESEGADATQRVQYQTMGRRWDHAFNAQLRDCLCQLDILLR